MLDKLAIITQKDLYEDYCKYRGEKRPLLEKSFTRRLREQFGIETQRIRAEDGRIRYYNGIGYPISADPISDLILKQKEGKGGSEWNDLFPAQEDAKKS